MTYKSILRIPVNQEKLTKKKKKNKTNIKSEEIEKNIFLDIL